MTVLIVDDSRMVRIALTAKLKKLGLEVIQAEDGSQAIDKIFDEKPSLVFMDVMMPGTNGIEICRHIRQFITAEEMPVIILTSKRDENMVKKAIKAGANDYLAKPFKFEDLVMKLSKHLDVDFDV